MNTEATWQDCIACGSAKKITPQMHQAANLIETADKRLAFAQADALTEENASFIFEDHYASTLEYLHANLLEKGYKVANHICIAYYLRDVQNDNELYALFNDARYKRNQLTYYGERVGIATARRAIDNLRRVREALKQ